MSKSGFKNQKGAALLMDVLISMGIIIFIAALSTPYFRQYKTNMVLIGTARDLTADLRLAQQSTVTEQVVYLLEFNTIERKYSVEKMGAATTTVKTVALPEGVDFQSISPGLEDKVIFNSFGAVNQSGQIVLVATDDSRIATINIKPSGYVELSQ